MTDKQQLLAMRITIVVFTALVLAYAIAMQGTPIYDLVSGAYQVTLVGAFVPLVMGLYWKRATTQGAIFSVAAGIARLAAVLPAGRRRGSARRSRASWPACWPPSPAWSRARWRRRCCTTGTSRASTMAGLTAAGEAPRPRAGA